MAQLQGVWPPLANAVEQLVALAQNYGIPARITSGYRTYAQQARLYRRYLAGTSLYPVAPPGYSDHERGLAVDVWTGSEELNAQLGAAWNAAGGVWSPVDAVHFTVHR